MILIFHITVALSSLGFTGYAFLSPSKAKLQASYVLVAATVASGFYLMWTQPAHMTQTCITGLAYLAAVGVGIFATHRKLSAQRI